MLKQRAFDTGKSIIRGGIAFFILFMGIHCLNQELYSQDLREKTKIHHSEYIKQLKMADSLRWEKSGLSLSPEYLKILRRHKKQMRLEMKHNSGNLQVKPKTKKHQGISRNRNRQVNRKAEDLQNKLKARKLELKKKHRERFRQFRREHRPPSKSALKSGIPQAAAGPVLEQDSLALVALYNATDGDNWTENTNWLSGPVAEWYGVTVEGNRIIELNLEENNLTGTIPPELENLTSLEILNLFENNLTGPIPQELGQLSNLVYLWLSVNELSGEIPPELGNLINLEELSLGGFDSNLEGSIPEEFSNLASLTFLDLTACNLTGSIPAFLSQLTNLQLLWLNFNNFTGAIPPELGNLSNLRSLRIPVNNLTGSIPPELGNLSNLSQLWLDSNNLTGQIPSELGQLSNMIDLSFSGNELSGAIPPELTNLASLRELDIVFNNLTDLPDLASLDALEFLEVGRNRFTFEDIEPNIGVASENFLYSPQDSIGTASTENINTGDNLTLSFTVGGENNEYQWYHNGIAVPGATNDTYTITSAVLEDAGEYILQTTNTMATNLTLYSRPVTVNVDPGPVAEQDSLALVALYNAADGDNWNDNTNWLSGPIRDWFGVTVAGNRVADLSLDFNNLTGNIPPEMGNLDSLLILSLTGNNLIGSLPPEIGDLANLRQLLILSTEITGAIPPELGNLKNLSLFALSDNKLTGSIPSELGNLTNLSTFLALAENDLTGPIPPELANLDNLLFLNLFNNNLSGSIPPELAGMQSLLQIWVSGNELSGAIPSELGNMASLQTLNLDENKLTGEIPPEVGDLPNLFSINLQDNQLSGAIPVELEGVPFIVVGNNQLEGAVPEAWGDSDSLFYLGLDDNLFTSIPDFSGADSLNVLLADSLKLTFSDIIPNLDLPLDSLAYKPQKPFGQPQNISAAIGASAVLTPSVDLPENQYQWFKDGTAISGAISRRLNIDEVTESDYGEYHVEVTNPNVPEMTIRSELFTLEKIHRNLTIDYNSGWQLVSLPVASDDGVNNHFPTADTVLYAYTGHYELVSSLLPGKGYWLKFGESGPAEFEGAANSFLQLQLQEGWNLIGTAADSASYAAIDDPDDILIEGTLTGFTGAYTNEDKIAPGRGYWIRSSGTGTITLKMDTELQTKSKTAPVVESFDRLEISNGQADQILYLNGKLDDAFTLRNFALPPVPPKPLLDARFEGDYRLAKTDSAAFELTSKVYPVTLTYQPGLTPSNYLVAGLKDGKPVSIHELKSGQSIKLNRPYKKIGIWKKSVSDKELPEKFALEQNYPNPFNPTTTIRYELPVQSEVSMVIYDMLGRRITTLVDTELEPGSYTATFDGSSLASGIYILRMQTESFEKIQKLTLIK